MGLNNVMAEVLAKQKRSMYAVTEEMIPVRKKLSDITADEMPDDACYNCRYWVAVSKELHLGECHANSPRRGKSPEIPEYPQTPPQDFCRHHWHRKKDGSTFNPNNKR